MKKLLVVLLITGICFSMCACGSINKVKETVDLNKYSLDEIVTKAKEEGHIESVGMPDFWANWGATWEMLTSEYGITHTDEDMTSAEELAMFQNDATRDIGDVGYSFTKQLGDLVQPYKTSYWDSVPEWAKDSDGKWMIPYTGCTAFIFNSELSDEPMPQSWQDIKNAHYRVTLDDVINGASPQAAIIASAYAFGGDLDNLQPAFDFWEELAKEGRLDPSSVLSPSRIQTGEVVCGVEWSYTVLEYANGAKNYNVICGIPQDGAILLGYASVINKIADNPFSAALVRELIFSDEGQINLAKSGAIPTRTNVTIPQEVIDATFDPTEYENAVAIYDVEKYADACQKVANWWSEEIVPLLS